MNSQAGRNGHSKAWNIGLWVLQILTAAAFVMAGFGKLSGQQEMVDMFEKVGVGQWFRYVTGTIEIVAAVLLVIPRLVPAGAFLLIPTMVGATLTHLVLGGSPLPAVVLGLFAGTILWGRFDIVREWLGASAVPSAFRN